MNWFIIFLFLEELAGSLLFFSAFDRRKNFGLRLIGSTLAAGGVYYLLGCIELSGSLWLALNYLLDFVVIMIPMRWCFACTWEQALYASSAGRATQHFASNFGQIVIQMTGAYSYISNPNLLYLVRMTTFNLPCYVLIYLLFARKMDTSPTASPFRRRMNLISLAVLFVCIIISRLAKDNIDRAAQTVIAEGLYAMTCCILCLVIQFELCRHQQLEQDVELVRALRREESKQFADRRDIIEQINIKCHDIRHKIDNYRLPLTDQEKNDVESLIRIYDTTFHTGNSALDVLLTDRALLCEKKRIQLTFLGDGTCLEFLSESELYSLLGNALDNAIAAVSMLDEGKRQISLLVRHSGDLISMNMTNYYCEELRFEAGLPLTTQCDNRQEHGYGMKSMRQIATQHGGDLQVKAENGIFELTMYLVKS